MKKILKIVGVVIAIIVIIGVFFITRGLKEGAAMTMQDINPSVFSDGKYYGIYREGRWLSEVDVIIKDQKIILIELLSEPMIHPGKADFSQELFDRVIAKQTTNIDVISGATVTSKAYLKSVENALNK
ncbi:FMN-binding protein [Cellulosilyticum sp. I15G10I2]|uniref:FMN-binding protein n=1 Tax=Cellulosilyticum sp. I15G10I2 TaxID=1892843 RepID=UPI00085CA4F5|nr:FMN-binding protein [Cellulosilyticum sp. I15G10I2]